MAKLHLHIGFGKCGSSALQTALTLNHTLHGAFGKIRYAAVIPRQLVIKGEQLQEYARCQPHGYTCSIPELVKFSLQKPMRNRIRTALTPDCDWILSQEGWNRRADEFAAAGLLESLGREVHVIAYVRPQVEWLNSACWQWFYWHDCSSDPSTSLSRCGAHTMDWEHWLAKWEQVPSVRSVTVRLLPRDIFSDFATQLGVDPASTIPVPSNNTTLPLEAISLLARMGQVRGPTNSVVDFILQNHVDFTGRKPWAVRPEQAAEVIESHRESNLRLIKRLDPESAGLMKSDHRWWDAEYYREHAVDFPRDVSPSPAQAQKWLIQAMRGLISTQNELSEMQRSALMDQWAGGKS